MRNKLLLFSILIGSLFISSSVSGSQTFSESETLLNRQKAVEMIRENSAAVIDAEHNKKNAKKDYEYQLNKSKTVDTEKTFAYHDPYNDEDVYYYYDSTEQMQMRLLKEFLPEQMKYAWEVRSISAKVIENSIANMADNLFAGLYSTSRSVLMAERTLEIAKQSYEREKIRYESGMITELDLKISGLNVEEAENSVKKAIREFDNIHRKFNMMAGLPLDFRYDLIGTPWSNNNKIPYTEEDAVKSALANRMEIWDLKQQIRLIVVQMDIYRYKDVYKFHQNTKEDYNEALDNLEKLKLKLSETEYNIEKEIRKAYKDLEMSYLDLEIKKETLIKQKNKLDTITKQYNSGFVPASALEQMEHAVNQLELAVNISLITAINKSDQLNRAISVGPGY